MSGVKLSQELQDGIVILRVSGFMDMLGMEKFVQTLDRCIMDGTSKIILDFKFLEYISSAGLGAIIGRIRDLRRVGGDIKIGGYSDRVFELFQTFGFTETFDICDDIAKALANFKNPS